MSFYTMPDGETLFVREYGQGQPVLVLSGLGMLSWQWAAFLYPYRKHYRFIIPEWRGFGASSTCKIPNIDAIRSHWQDIQCLVQQLKLNDVIIIAYSMGATTTMHGLKYGNFAQHIRAYLHIDQTPKIRVDDDWAYGLFGSHQTQFIQILQKISDLLDAQQQHESLFDLDNQARQQLAELWLEFIKLQNDQPQQIKLFRWLLNQPQLGKFLYPSKNLAYMKWYIDNYLYHAEDYRAALTALRCPVTFFTGVQSKLYAADGQTQIAQAMPQAKQVLFHKSGHTPLINEPIKFAKEIAKFLHAQHLESKQSA